MCLIIWVNKDIFVGEKERINEDESRFRRSVRRLVSKFIPGREASPPPYAEGASVQQGPRKATFKRPDSLTLPMYAGYRKHVGAQILEEVAGSEK
jgi:hypothetical protein